MSTNGRDDDSHSYGGDEEPTPAQPGVRVSLEARAFASLALEFNHASVLCWSSSRLLDATTGDNRRALLAKLIAELSTLIEATAATRESLIKQQSEVEQ